MVHRIIRKSAAWQPALVSAMRGYSALLFRQDLAAGVTVGLVALPLAIAFGIASGVTPQAGLYTAIVGGFIVSVFGGSRLQIGGPTGAFVVIVAGIIARHGTSGLLMVTLMAGVMLIALGLTGLGTAIKFIPRPIVIGFTNGIALLIASTQIRDFFGLRVPAGSSEFFARIGGLLRYAHTIDRTTTIVAVGSLATIVAFARFWPRVPGAVVALAGATIVVSVFHLHVDTIATRFGHIPAGLPQFSIPQFRLDLVLPLLPSAMTVALLAAVESLLSAVVADTMTGDRHNSSVELIAQGIANLAVPFVGGIPVTGAIARTATNVRSGARTPVAGLIHAATLLAIVWLFAPLASSIPLAALAAILIVVAYNMGEWREIRAVVRLDNAARSVWIVTFVLTVVADLTLAVGVGMSLAALLYIYRISQTTTVSLITPDDIEEGRAHILADTVLPAYVSIVRIHGPFLFGTTESLSDRTSDLSQFGSILILRLRNMTAIDATGMHALEALHARVERSGRTLLLCGARDQPGRYLHRANFVGTIGPANILPNVRAALARAGAIHDALSGQLPETVISATRNDGEITD